MLTFIRIYLFSAPRRLANNSIEIEKLESVKWIERDGSADATMDGSDNGARQRETVRRLFAVVRAATHVKNGTKRTSNRAQ